MLQQITGIRLLRPLWNDFSFEKVLQYYDGPRLLLQKSHDGQLYLAWWCDSDESVDRWLYLPLSEGRLNTILSGEVSDFDALNNPEDGYLFVVDVDLDTDSIVQTILTDANALPDDILPDPAVRLSVATPEEMHSFSSEIISQISSAEIGSHLSGQAVRFMPTFVQMGAIKSCVTAWGTFVEDDISSLQIETSSAQTGNYLDWLNVTAKILGEGQIPLGSPCRVVLRPPSRFFGTAVEERSIYTLLGIESEQDQEEYTVSYS